MSNHRRAVRTRRTRPGAVQIICGDPACGRVIDVVDGERAVYAETRHTPRQAVRQVPKAGAPLRMTADEVLDTPLGQRLGSSAAAYLQWVQDRSGDLFIWSCGCGFAYPMAPGDLAPIVAAAQENGTFRHVL